MVQNVRKGPVGMVLPLADFPLSAQQVEERSESSHTETMTSGIYRDTAGRMRIEWRITSSPDGPFDFVQLIDPGARSTAMLLPEAKIAFVTQHVGSGPFQVGFPSVGEWR